MPTLGASWSPVPTSELLGTSLVQCSGSQPAWYTLVLQVPRPGVVIKVTSVLPPHHHPQFERIYCGHSWYNEED